MGKGARAEGSPAAAQNLLFWGEVDSFQMQWDSKTPEQRTQDAIKITDKFLRAHSLLEVNLQSTVRNKIMQDVQQNAIDATVFARAQKEARRPSPGLRPCRSPREGARRGAG